MGHEGKGGNDLEGRREDHELSLEGAEFEMSIRHPCEDTEKAIRWTNV